MSVAAKKGLGTGLDVLFGESTKEEKPPEGVSKLPIAKVEPRDNQPRSVFDEEALAELAESIREYGVIQPVTVRSCPPATISSSPARGAGAPRAWQGSLRYRPK